MNRWLTYLFTLALLPLVVAACGGDTSDDPTSVPDLVPPSEEPTDRQYSAPPPLTLDVNKSYTARLNTNMGIIDIELFAAAAPTTVNNFIFLARDGYYDGVTFHRVIKDFMIQSGDPTGTGGGSPGYQFEDEIVASLIFDRPGLLAMANSGPNTNGSQFFITVVPTPWLNGRHTIFGEVINGQEIVDQISLVAKTPQDRPLEPVVIESLDITER